MISQQAILQEIEKQLQHAKAGNVTASLTAIKALCDVVLQQPDLATPTSQSVAQPSIIPQSTPTAEEDGANGNSLFDF